jgi:hypothetical protein
MFETKVLKHPIKMAEIKKMATEGFGDMVKAVVDVERGVVALGAELHVDAETILIGKEGSAREHTWGINIYPAKEGSEFIEFDSMVNIKPAFGNRSRDVENPVVREKIIEAVKKLIV